VDAVDAIIRRFILQRAIKAVAREESRSVWFVLAMEFGIPLVGPAFQPVKTTAWKGYPTTTRARG